MSKVCTYHVDTSVFPVVRRGDVWKCWSAGVSNFNVGELEELQRMARVPPAVVQNHIDLFAQNRDVQWWCRHTRTLCQVHLQTSTHLHTVLAWAKVVSQ